MSSRKFPLTHRPGRTYKCSIMVPVSRVTLLSSAMYYATLFRRKDLLFIPVYGIIRQQLERIQMTQQAPGKAHRKGISLVEAVRQFSNELEVEKMFVEQRWPDGVVCPKCDSDNVAEVKSRKPQPFRCRSCRKHFSVKVGTVMEGSNIPLSKWALCAYLMSTNLKGVSSMKLHRDLDVTQKTAWFLSHRIRKAWEDESPLFAGPVEVDETYIGGKRKNMHAWKREQLKGRGTEGKTPIVGIRDRHTGKVFTKVVDKTNRATLQGVVHAHVEFGSVIITDEHAGYVGLPNHFAVRHSVGEYVNGEIHTNGIESHWATLKRGINGVYHHMSAKHVHRYGDEFAGRHNDRPADTIEQVHSLIRGMEGKRLKFDDLIGPENTRLNLGNKVRRAHRRRGERRA